MTKGTKLQGHNVLVRVYRDDGAEGDENITIAAFVPSEQSTLEYTIGPEQFRELFHSNGGGEEDGRISDDVIREKAAGLLHHLKIVSKKTTSNRQGSSTKTLDLDINKQGY